MKLLWTWSGKFFGYLEKDILRTQDGQHVGQLHDAEIYGPNGVYLGELMTGLDLFALLPNRVIAVILFNHFPKYARSPGIQLIVAMQCTQATKIFLSYKRERHVKFKRFSPSIPL